MIGRWTPTSPSHPALGVAGAAEEGAGSWSLRPHGGLLCPLVTLFVLTQGPLREDWQPPGVPAQQ